MKKMNKALARKRRVKYATSSKYGKMAEAVTAKSRKSRRYVRIQLDYVLDLGRYFFEGPHEIAGLKDDVGGLIIRGLLHANPRLRARYEAGDIKLVPDSIKLIATPCTTSEVGNGRETLDVMP